jgi:demethylmenaquinone methyltransferase/2-methoxy-6-polyprenyl-1,4-benzoquinol methylase
MFDDIAGRYDFLNHALSAGLDRRWRRRAIRELALTGRERLVDICTGTADLAVEAATHTRGHARDVVGLDFSGAMLAAMRLPISDGSCDAVTVGFGIRNVVDPLAACQEMARILRPGGRLAILEFSMPTTPVVRNVYQWYFRRVLPAIGRLVSRHHDAYAYLPASVQQFPSGPAFGALLGQAGFTDVAPHALAAGAVWLYVARKGGSHAPPTGTPVQ